MLCNCNCRGHICDSS